MEKLLNVEQAAEYLGVQPSTVRNWLRESKITGVKLGGGKQWRITESALRDFVAASQVNAHDKESE